MRNFFKKQKSLIMLSIVVLLGFLGSCSDDENVQENNNSSKETYFKIDNMLIGEIRNGEMIITADKLQLLAIFSKFAETQGLGYVEYFDLEISKKEIIIDGKSVSSYGLFSSDINGVHNSVIPLELEGNYLKVSGGKGSITCTSQNCGTGCTPYEKAIDGGKVWTCSSCSTTCTKSMSVSIG